MERAIGAAAWGGHTFVEHRIGTEDPPRRPLPVPDRTLGRAAKVGRFSPEADACAGQQCRRKVPRCGRLPPSEGTATLPSKVDAAYPFVESDDPIGRPRHEVRTTSVHCACEMCWRAFEAVRRKCALFPCCARESMRPQPRAFVLFPASSQTWSLYGRLRGASTK
jgi:hypothetical protein